jgi:hypothetical protein
MNIAELRDQDEARQFLLQGLCLQRCQPPLPATVLPALDWALEVVSAGQPLPPLGFVADLGNALLDVNPGVSVRRETAVIPGLNAGVIRTYEDHVLGKLYADWTCERAGDALRRYQGRERARALAFVLNQFRERAGFGGVHLTPALFKSLRKDPPERLLAQGWESLHRTGLHPLLSRLYENLVSTIRRTAEVLGTEDLFELEHGTAVNDFGQRLALRQVLRAAQRLQSGLSHHRPRPRSRRQEVPTRVLDEDTYPVGGFSSLSTRGSIESLLHSQLAFMETSERPDLFDIKLVRDELLYYARDENRFLRRRRTYVLVLFPDLVQARFKDAELPYQRIILLLALLVATIRQLSEWLSTDALRFEIFLLREKNLVSLLAERDLLETLLRELIANDTVELRSAASPGEVEQHCTRRARRSLCQCLAVSMSGATLQPEETTVTRLQLSGPRPALGMGAEIPIPLEGEDALAGWSAALETLLAAWV